jgi:hypothetical protein
MKKQTQFNLMNTPLMDLILRENSVPSKDLSEKLYNLWKESKGTTQLLLSSEGLNQDDFWKKLMER